MLAGNPRDRMQHALKVHADESGHVSGTFDDIRSWVGPDAASWDIHAMLIALKDAGSFRSHFWQGQQFDVSFY